LRLSRIFCSFMKRCLLLCFPISQSICYCCKSTIPMCTY
jgi:hypothetical protein